MKDYHTHRVTLPFDRLINNAEFSDITLQVGERSFHAHRIILCSWSDVFKSKIIPTTIPGNNLSSHGQSSSQTSSVSLRIDEEDQDCCDVFDQFLSFMYTAKLALSNENFFPLLKLGVKYDIHDIVQLCEKYLVDVKKDVCSAVSVLQQATKFGMRETIKSCLSIIRTNFEVVTSNHLQHLDDTTLVELLDNPDEQVVVSDEFSVFTKLEPWLKACTDREALMKVISCIRFPFMSAIQLTQISRSDIMKRVLEDNPTFMVEAFQKHALYSEAFFSELTGTIPLPRLYLDKLSSIPSGNPTVTGKPDKTSFISITNRSPQYITNELTETKCLTESREDAHFYQYNKSSKWRIMISKDPMGNTDASAEKPITLSLDNRVRSEDKRTAVVAIQVQFEDGSSHFFMAKKSLATHGNTGVERGVRFEFKTNCPPLVGVNSTCKIRAAVIVHGFNE
ncbi:BTB/POZ domain-containing protein 17-like [Diadema setosum]|uniref:BTB/POZ domain-containing protein 17-like n=1 Tax=Diadema setosum TaxID=31175 RepID=UPI003B3B687A